MLKNNDEMGNGANNEPNSENKSNLKKFSDIARKPNSKNNKVDTDHSIRYNDIEPKQPMNPNLPENRRRREVPMDTDDIMNNKPNPEFPKRNNSIEENVNLIGKVAKFKKKVQASKAYSFLENVKISKSAIWYLMIEKQADELQMIKYNYKEGVDLNKFVNELKVYYMKKYSTNQNVSTLIENIKVDGTDKYSIIKNIPQINIDGKKMISKITEDLIVLLSK